MLSNIIDEPQADRTNSRGAGTTRKHPARTYGMPHDGPQASPVLAEIGCHYNLISAWFFRWYALKEPLVVPP